MRLIDGDRAARANHAADREHPTTKQAARGWEPRREGRMDVKLPTRQAQSPVLVRNAQPADVSAEDSLAFFK